MGHADRFWAGALGLMAGSTSSGPIEYHSRGKKRAAYSELKGYLS
jgi:hypothetical protein